MNKIHRKTAIAETSDILLAAYDQGESFHWGRYEAQLPLCAFTANGLSCRKCFQGPCRINPFGDEPSRGVCGADRDQIVMESLFQATLDGVLETARSLALLDERFPGGNLPDAFPELPRETVKRLTAEGVLPVRKEDLFAVQNSYFSSKAYLGRTLRDLARLGLIHYRLLKEMQARFESFGRELPVFHPEGVNILITGQAPLPALNGLVERAGERPGGKAFNLFLEPSKAAPGFLTLADHGSPELALAMNLDALLIGADASFPALAGLAEKTGIPVFLAEEAPEKVLDLALQHHRGRSYLTSSRLLPAPPGMNPGPLDEKKEEIRGAFRSGDIQGILVVFAEPNVKQSFFARSLDLAEEGIRRGLLVLIAGAISAQVEPLSRELTRRFGGTPPRSPLLYPGSFYDIPNWVPFFRELNSGRGFDRLAAVISFPEFYRTSTWAAAVTFLSLGFAVQIGTPLPFWGSPGLTEILLKQWPRVSGGILLASPGLPDSQTQAREIGEVMETRKGGKA